ncbi:MAG: TldD protein, partial [Pelagibacterales bacterium]|nr:TldD protein [Pelagibacterales bacterium]
MNDFFKKTDLTRNEVEKIIDETLLNKDDGELYLQNS